MGKVKNDSPQVEEIPGLIMLVSKWLIRNEVLASIINYAVYSLKVMKPQV